MTLTPHDFAIKDEDLFASPLGTDLRALKCTVCGLQPGQGVHTPPKPPLSRIIADEVAKTLAGATGEPLTACFPVAPRAAFQTVQHVREFLKRMGEREVYSDSRDMGDPFGDIDEALGVLLNELLRLGWSDQQGT